MLSVIANMHMFREFEIVHWALLNQNFSHSSEVLFKEALLLTAHATKLKLSEQKTNRATEVFHGIHCPNFVEKFTVWTKENPTRHITAKVLHQTHTRLLRRNTIKLHDENKDGNLNGLIESLLAWPTGQVVRHIRVNKIRELVLPEKRLYSGSDNQADIKRRKLSDPSAEQDTSSSAFYGKQALMDAYQPKHTFGGPRKPLLITIPLFK